MLDGYARDFRNSSASETTLFHVKPADYLVNPASHFPWTRKPSSMVFQRSSPGPEYHVQEVPWQSCTPQPRLR
jgi:hypothetical protein